MYCPKCGAAEQNQRFCAGCGSAIAVQSASPMVNTTTNVHVNVGAPMPVVDGKNVVMLPRLAPRQEGTGWFRHPGAIVAALIVFFPLGLVLMWAYAPWRTTTKVAVSGIFFWPLWTVLVWKTSWPLGLRVAGVVLIVAASVGLFTPASGLALVAGIVIFLWSLWFLRTGTAVEHHDDASDSLRARIADTLHGCNGLIEDIEGTIAVSLLPADSPVRRRYVASLEERHESDALMNAAATPADLGRASVKAEAALAGLRTVRDAL